MIQRIQTVFLILAAVIMALSAYLCFRSDWMETRHLLGGLFSVIATIDSLLTAFYFYKNRKVQMVMCWSLVVVCALASIGTYVALIAIPFLLLAWRGIRADERLVRSIDRIR